jgi:hypothetical protein
MILPGVNALAASLHDNDCGMGCGDESDEHQQPYREQSAALIRSALASPETACRTLDAHADLLDEKVAAHEVEAAAATGPIERTRHLTAARGLAHRAAGVREARDLIERVFSA